MAWIYLLLAGVCEIGWPLGLKLSQTTPYKWPWIGFAVAGATLVWGLGMTLWLPWFDAQKSYRSTALAMQAAIPSDANCVATASTHYVQRALWYYFAGIRLLPTEQTAGAACQYRMVMHYRSDYQPSPQWQIIWQGNRPGSRRELYFLLKKQ